MAVPEELEERKIAALDRIATALEQLKPEVMAVRLTLQNIASTAAQRK